MITVAYHKNNVLEPILNNVIIVFYYYKEFKTLEIIIILC